MTALIPTTGQYVNRTGSRAPGARRFRFDTARHAFVVIAKGLDEAIDMLTNGQLLANRKSVIWSLDATTGARSRGGSTDDEQ